MNNFAPADRHLLSEHGWQFLLYAKGHHEIWLDPATQKKVTVDSKIKSRHSANGVLKDAGLPKAF